MLRQSRLTSLRDTGDAQYKLMLDRVNFVEKLYSEITTSFFEYTRKISRTCEKYDEIAKIFNYYSEIESHNKTLSDSLSNFSKAMTFLGDFKEMEVQRLDKKVISELQQYEQLCKSVKDDLKCSFTAKEKEIMKRRQLEQIRQRSLRDKKKLTTLDGELKKSKLELLHATKEIDEIFEIFEKEKLKHIKSILLDFISIELKQHTKSIEVLTAAYQDFSEIDEEKDFDNFKETLDDVDEIKPAGYLSRIKSQSMGAINSIFNTGSFSKRGDSLSHSTNSINSPNESPVVSMKSKRILKKNLSINQSIEEISNSSDSHDNDDEDDIDIQSLQSHKGNDSLLNVKRVQELSLN